MYFYKGGRKYDLRMCKCIAEAESKWQWAKAYKIDYDLFLYIDSDANSIHGDADGLIEFLELNLNKNEILFDRGMLPVEKAKEQRTVLETVWRGIVKFSKEETF